MRVVKATSYGPPTSQRRSGRLTTARPAPGLPRAPIRAHPARRSACGAGPRPGSPPHAETLRDLVRHIRAGDLEVDVAKPVEVVVQLRRVGTCEREGRSVGSPRLGKRHDVRRRERISTDLLGDLWPLLDRSGDQLPVPAAQFQATKPRADLLARQVSTQRGQAEAPWRDAEAVLLVQLPQPVEQPDRLLVGEDVRMDFFLGPELGEARDCVAHVALAEQCFELVAEARAGKVADMARRDALAGEPGGVVVHAEAVTVLVADRAKDARWIVDERTVVEDSDAPSLEVLAAVERVDELAERVTFQRDGHRVDREVAAMQVFVDGAGLDRREDGRGGVGLVARGHDVDAPGGAVEDDEIGRAHV